MNEYIFYTSEGFTKSPNETDCENMQILGFEKGENLEEAKSNLLKNNQWILKYGFSKDEIKANQFIDKSTVENIKTVINYLWKDEEKHFEEEQASGFVVSNHIFNLPKADKNCVELLNQLDFQFDMIFADPPYFLSNGGISVQSGKQVCVDKGGWDKSQGFEKDNDFNRKWISACRSHLKSDGTIWISGTYHNIFSAAQMLNELDFRILNCITWAKTNPPPNLSCRFFTHSTEFILWARKEKKVPHYFNYELMKKLNGGKQMRDLWTLPAIAKWEKSCGKHPTQKPLPLLARIILASTKENARILDPFAGSSTTGIAANLFERKFLGIEKETEFLELSKRRREEIENPKIRFDYKKRIEKFSDKPFFDIFELRENEPYFRVDLPF